MGTDKPPSITAIQALPGSAANQIDVPFVDLRPMNGTVEHAVLNQFAAIIRAGTFVNGPHVRQFEEAFAAYCGTANCVGTSSGLDAVRLGLLAAGIGPGDEVIVPANTFVATVEAVSQTGAHPILIDASERDYNLDVVAAEAAVTPRTRAIVPVHLYGQVADMRSVQALALRHEIVVVEDACQAHGAMRDGLRAGGCGDAAAFSFYPAKNLGAMGDAGALTSNDVQLADRVRALREHGQRVKYDHEFQGYTARLDTVQAAVLLEKLPHLERWNEARREAARFYLEALTDVGDLVLAPVPNGSEPVWHLFVIRTQAPEALADFLSERGIATGRHYPTPPHLSSAYRSLRFRPGSLPVAERLAAECLSLPIFPGIRGEQLDAVVQAIRSYFDHG
jgi:dTDP-4-amino-4,6-dideoxygalactose transaminase